MKTEQSSNIKQLLETLFLVITMCICFTNICMASSIYIFGFNQKQCPSDSHKGLMIRSFQVEEEVLKCLFQ